MSDVLIRRSGRAGRITLNRPKALNALTYDMLLGIETALDAWRDDPAVDVVVIDAAGEKAFCAGGDIADMYRTARAGDFAYGRTFWADEYRLNAKIAEYPKPYVALMQGFTMGGGVGVSCHGSHRIVGESSRIAMPECAIGLVPDVGGSMILGQASGRSGEYLGTTGARMSPSDAIYIGFADSYVPILQWPDLIAAIEATGSADIIADWEETPPPSDLEALQDSINAHFGAGDLAAIWASLAEGDRGETTGFAARALKGLGRVSPLSAAATLSLLDEVRQTEGIHAALELEYRFTWRAAEHGDFVEGIRAAIIDKDNTPQWRHGSVNEVTPAEVAAMLAPLPDGHGFAKGSS